MSSRVIHGGLSRRRFLGASAAGALACGCGLRGALAASSANPAGQELSHWLELANTHTSETLRVVYRSASGFVPAALERLQWVLRDHRANESAPIDPQLFDQLAALAAAAGVEPRFQIISGYRSSLTNAALAAAGRGVARQSLHMQGKALDVRLQGVACDRLRDLALAASWGGVGYYPKSDFVHLDTGRVRAWSG